MQKDILELSTLIGGRGKFAPFEGGSINFVGSDVYIQKGGKQKSALWSLKSSQPAPFYFYFFWRSVMCAIYTYIILLLSCPIDVIYFIANLQFAKSCAQPWHFTAQRSAKRLNFLCVVWIRKWLSSPWPVCPSAISPRQASTLTIREM